MKITVFATYDHLTPGEVEQWIDETFRCGHVTMSEKQIDDFRHGQEVEILVKAPNSKVSVKLSYHLEGF
jgi:hypothetical protein